MGYALLKSDEFLVDEQPAPLNLNERQALSWANEFCDEAIFQLQTPNRAGGWTIKCFGVKTYGRTLLKAICQAAAKHAEGNDISAEMMEKNL
jgi:hypothetical protein